MRPEGGCNPWKSTAGAVPDQSCIHGEEPLVGQVGWGSSAGQCLKDGPCDIELCWGSVWRAAACGKPRQDQLGKDSIRWEGPTWRRGKE